MYRNIGSTADQDHVKSQEVPPNNVTDGTSVPHTRLSGYVTRRQHEEEAVMQIRERTTDFWRDGLVITLWTSWWIRDLR